MDFEDCIFIIIGIFAFFALKFISNENEIELQKELELIKNTKDYQVYEKCYEFDEQYYCYDVVEE